jgi:4'-phosphopantetheinyl transferase
MFNANWTIPDACQLVEGELHVWLVDLELCRDQFQALWKNLSPDEHYRAERYFRLADQNRFVLMRGVVRELLGRYLSVPARSLEFKETGTGKPFVVSPRFFASFNISHSQDQGIVAIAKAGTIGVDLEWMDPALDRRMLTKRCLSQREREALRALPEADKDDGFLVCWTRKEAFLKAAGMGLSLEMSLVDTALIPGQPARLLAVNGNEEYARQWFLADLPAVPDHHAAIAAEGQNWTLRCWRWTA